MNKTLKRRYPGSSNKAFGKKVTHGKYKCFLKTNKVKPWGGGEGGGERDVSIFQSKWGWRDLNFGEKEKCKYISKQMGMEGLKTL